MLKNIISLLLLSFSLSAYSNQSEMEEAKLAVQRGDYAIAYCIWNELAKENDAESLYNLGWLYHNGYGLAINDAKALEFWTRSAETGYTEALFSIGNLYRLGSDEIERDGYKAAEYFVSAIKENHEDSAEMLNVLINNADTALFKQLEPLILAFPDQLGRVININVDRANFRPAPNLNTRVLKVLEQDAELVEIERKGPWIRAATREEGLQGWIHVSVIRVKSKK